MADIRRTASQGRRGVGLGLGKPGTTRGAGSVPVSPARGVRLTPSPESFRSAPADQLGNDGQDTDLTTRAIDFPELDGGAPAHAGGRKDRREGERIAFADRWRKPPPADGGTHQASLALLLARPVLLLVCAVLGAAIGFGLGGHGGYQSSATVEFTTPGTDSNLAKITGQTIAGTATSADVIKAATPGLGANGVDLANRVTAEWQQDTQLVSVTVTADSPAAAVAGANAVAQTLVSQSAASIQARLQAAFNESNKVLTSKKLASAEAETARRTQLGSSLGSRQDAIAGESGALTVSDSATSGAQAGLSRSMAAAIGLVAALLLAGLASLLLGIRGLKAPSERALHRLAPDLDLRDPADAAAIAGQLVESGETCVAVVAAHGVRQAAIRFGHDVSFFAQALGSTVALVGPAEFDEGRQGVELLSRRRRADVRQFFGTDMVVAVIPAGSDASNLLKGQSDLAAIVVVRKRRTPVVAALTLVKAFARARPVVVLAG